MRRKTAKEILAESFLEIAEKKSIDKITIREITENCGYSTATFYRQFHDKYDLIVWEYTERMNEIMKHMTPGRDGWNKTLRECALYFAENKEYLSNLLLHTTGFDSFIRNMTEIHYRSFYNYIIQTAGAPSLDQEVEMYIRTYCHGTVGIASDWILGKFDCSPEKLAEIFMHSLPVNLRQYIHSDPK